MGELNGQAAIVTGGGRGIGRAIARAFAAAGAVVAVTARSVDELAETVALIEGSGGRALTLPADVSCRSAIEAVVCKTEERLGPVDVLVNNAGVSGPVGPIWEVDPEEWQRCIEVDLVGPFLFARAALPGMVERRRGRIINVASAHALGPFPHGSGYGVAKTALVRLTETLAEESRPYGVTAFALDPALVRTRLTETVTSMPEWKRWMVSTPATAVGLPLVEAERPADLCVKLASGAADELSGRYIRVQDDFDALVQRAAEIQKEDLYRLRLRV
ncbi:MAG TPA: SDR family oxidoreductase [Dehalococcoidia bacterium]|nr:SDR family oxidoreductase [Dehalococcoidia bacterium]